MAEGRVILVGESNPYGSEPEFALYCYPPGCAGYRLRRILGLPQHVYLELHRTNLCDGDWANSLARVRARQLLDPSTPWSVLVLLGRKVTAAFEHVALGGVGLVAFSAQEARPGQTLASLPHPSGRNAALWTAAARVRARQLLRELAPEVPWGSEDDHTGPSAPSAIGAAAGGGPA